MADSFTRFRRWLWNGKEKEKSSNGSTLNSDWSGFGVRELDSVKFPADNLASQREVKRKCHSREEMRTEKQFGGFVSVSSDGGVGMPGSESDDDPEWSIGWVEPHGPNFRSDDEADDGFAVLVPCYKSGCKELVGGSNKQLLSALKNLPNKLSSEGKSCMDWLSSLQNF